MQPAVSRGGVTGGERVPALDGRSVVYSDDAHMTPEYSRYLAPVLATVVVPVIDK